MAAAPLTRPIALVGMPGAGKSAVGGILAARLGLPFYDCDVEVERAAGCTIAELFARNGEAAFRRYERRTVAALLERGPIILATGGGAMAEAETRTLLLERSETIWLDAEPAILARRLADARDRPLLEGSDREAALARLLAERRPLYRMADHHVRTGDRDLVHLTEALLQLFTA